MSDPLHERTISGSIHNSRHQRIRWTAGQECGEDLFEEGVEFDGLTLTVEVSGRDDAFAMIKAIEAI
mgnify:CR=1 FL=1